MMTRDEYVEKLKAQVDQWNAQMATWEGATAAQLEQLRQKRDAAIAEMHRLQGASMDAWKDMMRGADTAFKAMQDAFEQARSKFTTKK